MMVVQVVKEMQPQYDKTQANQAPEGTLQSGVFVGQGERKPASGDPTSPDDTTSSAKEKLG